MGENIKVSIVTASYNYEDYIKETIQSVINQTFQDWEMLVVDDGSKDNSVEVIKSFCDKDKRIKLYQHENGENKGLIETVKLGIEKAQGEWVVFLESDDTITPDYIEEKLKVVNEHPEISFIYNDINLFGEEDAVKEMYEDYFIEFYETMASIKTQKDFVKEFRRKNIVPTFSVVMAKKSVLQTLNYDSAISKWVDYYLWTQLVPKFEFYYLPKKLTNWRIHKTSYNNSKNNSYKGVYFRAVQINDNLSCGRFKTWHRIAAIPLYIREFKRKFIRIHPKEKEIVILGKSFRFDKGKKNEEFEVSHK